MRNNRRARRSSQTGTFRRRSRIQALAALLTAAMISMPLGYSPLAQGTNAAPGGQPAAPTQAVPTPTTVPNSVAPTTAAPANAAPTTTAPQVPEPPGQKAAAPDSTATPPDAAAQNSESGATGVPSVGRAQLPEDLSPWGMFLNADIIVKGVIIGLAFASLVTWTVFVAKSFELAGARREVRRGLRILNKSATLAQAHDQLRNGTSAVARLMQSAAQEIRLSSNLRGDGLKERIAWELERIEAAVSRRTSRGTGVLATIGSTAPFVGLFGTVWGIMNSFIGISQAHTTNLAVVAPGIAQALLATALGLVAAIPAVMIYNVLARSTAHYRALLGDASAQVMRLVSRDLDRARLPLAQAAE
jgi:biopolymer transport protein ExbB